MQSIPILARRAFSLPALWVAPGPEKGLANAGPPLANPLILGIRNALIADAGLK